MEASWNELINKPKWWDEVINKSEDASYTYDLANEAITINPINNSVYEWVYNPDLSLSNDLTNVHKQDSTAITITDTGTLSLNGMPTINQLNNEEIFYPLPHGYQPKKYGFFPKDHDEVYEITANALDAGVGRVSRTIPVCGNIRRDSDTNTYTINIRTLNIGVGNKVISVELGYSEELLYSIIHQSFEADSTASMLEDLFYEDIYMALLTEFQKAFNDEKCS